VPSVFFGPSTQQLYGVFESPVGRPRKTGVLLLYPGVHEYMRAHWAFRSLASALAGRGFAVLRFDYRGTGNSSGEPEQTTFEACVDDARIAAEELRDTSGVTNVMLIGMRLGAAIAMHAGTQLSLVRRILLWNPVIQGSDYLDELEQMDRALRMQLLHELHHPQAELAGYRCPDAVRRSIERVDLREVGGAKRRVEIFSESVTPTTTFTEALERAGHEVQSHDITGNEPAAFPDAALLAQQALATLVARAAEGEA
jgi:pimeloyl-ACP methyl ester carboxylesterase